MIIYSGTKEKLNSDIVAGTLAHKISDEFVARLHYSTGAAEYRSWENSLHEMNAVLQMSALPDDVEIAVEFQIPLTSKRVDFMIAGLDENGQRNVVVVELKQWQQAQRTSREGLVTTYVGGAKRTVTHPSYQAYSYAKTIENFSATVQDENISLSPCAYLHNYNYEFENELSNGLYYDVVRLAPFYMKNEGEKLKAFIEKFIKKADRKQTLYEIDLGKIRPSKALQDAISSMLKGNEEFVMIDEQKVVYSTVKRIVEKALKERKKYTVIVQGGPGTGKSVVAMNLLVALKQYNVSYVTKNAAPRNVYFEKLRLGYRQSFIKNLFRSSGQFVDCAPNTFDCLIVDEAHRLNAKSGIFQSVGENQIKEIINASLVSVFFIDENQVVTSKDIGSINAIKDWAKKLNSEPYFNEDMVLVSQFRCNGSDRYVAFLDRILGLSDTDEVLSTDDFDFDIKLFEDPNQMRMYLSQKNAINNKARMLAGYCYEWASKNNPNGNTYDIYLENGFRAKWNFGNTSTWAIDADSFPQVGCIHTSQGLEFDYVGVIIGKDLRYENGKVITDPSKRAKSDKSLVGINSNPLHVTADRIIRNTYKTLLTRGQKGCYIYCEDKALFAYLAQWIPVATLSADDEHF